jgi:glycogen debranching enzyme
VKDSFIGSPGHIPEVLSGTANVPLDVSVPEQTWSSAALMTATVRGILGLNPDVPHKGCASNRICRRI